MRNVKKLGKIILLLMIVIMATGSPLYFDRIDADTFWERATDNDDVTPPVDENGPVEVAADYRFVQGEAGQYDLYVDLQILHGEVPYEEDLFVLEILIDQEPVRTLDFTSVSPEHSPGDLLTGETVEFHFSIDQKILELSDGEFELILRTDREEIAAVEEESFQIIFDRDFDYIASLLRNPQGRIPLVLYFPTEMTDYSVPVTRFITTSDRRLVQVALALAGGPDENLGLKSGDDYDFPSWGLISFQQGRTSVNIHGDFERFDDPQLWPPIFRAFTYSFLSTPGVRASDHQFYFNQEIREEAFGGVQVDEPVGFPDGPRLYFGYSTQTERALLVPVFLSEEDSFESVMGFFSEEGELLNPEGYYQLHQLRGSPHFL